MSRPMSVAPRGLRKRDRSGEPIDRDEDGDHACREKEHGKDEGGTDAEIKSRIEQGENEDHAQPGNEEGKGDVGQEVDEPAQVIREFVAMAAPDFPPCDAAGGGGAEDWQEREGDDGDEVADERGGAQGRDGNGWFVLKVGGWVKGLHGVQVDLWNERLADRDERDSSTAAQLAEDMEQSGEA